MSREIITAARLFLALFGMGAFSLSAAQAATLNVPSQYGTIQAAINASHNGDYVVVADGTYSGYGNRDMDFGGKNITVQSQHGSARTFINCGGYPTEDGSGDHRAFEVANGETNAVIIGFTIENGYAPTDEGAGIIIGSAVATVEYCSFQNCAAESGGGVYIFNVGSGTVSVNNCTFTGNNASEGAGICGENLGGGAVNIASCTFSGNTADYGGGINFRNIDTGAGIGSTLNATGCTFTGNTGGQGGGIFEAGGTINISGSTFTGNSSSAGGGIFNDGVYNDAATIITISQCTLTSNTVNDGEIGDGAGGGIYNGGGSGRILITQSTISGNSTANASGKGSGDGEGGGIYNYVYGDTNFASITVDRCTITNNFASADGGGICNTLEGSNNSEFVIDNCGLTGNTVGVAGLVTGLGSGISYQNANPGTGEMVVSNCTLTKNHCIPIRNLFSFSGSCVACLSGYGTFFVNDILWADGSHVTSVVGGGGELSFENGSSQAIFTDCDIQGGLPSTVFQNSTARYAEPLTANLTGDPLFENSPTDLHLKPGSPCLGAGIEQGASATITLDGRTRPNPPSIGAYELYQLPTTVSVTNITSVMGQPLVLKATLKTATGTPLSGEILSFQILNANVGTAVTNSSGIATIQVGEILLPVVSNTFGITVTFGGDGIYTASSGTGTLPKLNTSLSATAATDIQGNAVSLSASLSDSNGGAALQQETVTFSIDGTVVGSGVTSASGLATYSYAIPAGMTAGSHTIKAAFAGDGFHNSSVASATLTVKSATTLTAPLVSGSPGATVTLATVLKTTSGGKVLSGKTVTFLLGGVKVGTATTNSSGIAGVSYTIPRIAVAGSRATITVLFAGDSANGPASATGTLVVIK